MFEALHVYRRLQANTQSCVCKHACACKRAILRLQTCNGGKRVSSNAARLQTCSAHKRIVTDPDVSYDLGCHVAVVVRGTQSRFVRPLRTLAWVSIRSLSSERPTAETSLAGLRAYIARSSLDIKTAGEGRSKQSILEDVLRAESMRVPAKHDGQMALGQTVEELRVSKDQLKGLLDGGDQEAAGRMFEGLLEAGTADSYQLHVMLAHGGGSSDEKRALMERAEAAGGIAF